MATRWQITIVAISTLLSTPSTHAAIYRWDTGEVISGTEGIEPGPGEQFDWFRDEGLDLYYADFGGLDLRETVFQGSWLDNADFSGANLTGADFTSANLMGADLTDARLTNAVLVYANLTNTNLTGAIVNGAWFGLTTSRGLTKEQFYSTASYQEGNLQGIYLYANNLSGWDFSGQDLRNSVLSDHHFGSSMANANLSGADLRNAYLYDVHDIESAVFDSTTIYNQWTQFVSRFNPASFGLTFVESPKGDFNADDVLNTADVDRLASRLRGAALWGLPDAMFDLDSDANVDQEDHRIWVKDLKHTWFGDANLDGEFNSSDMVQAFAAGMYETGELASWAEGDWNGDGIFDSSDMVTAFADGGYEKGLRMDAVAVPEPGSMLLLTVLGGLLLAMRRRG